MAGLKLNFSNEEASSEARSFEPIPTGRYYARVTDIDERECGPESKNPGKPYWAVEFTIQDGPHEGRKVWTNAMLFEGALYTLAQLLKATGHAKALETGVVPDSDDLISKEVYVNVRKQRDTYAEERDGAEAGPQFKNEVKGIMAYESGGSQPAASGKKGKGGILP